MTVQCYENSTQKNVGQTNGSTISDFFNGKWQQLKTYLALRRQRRVDRQAFMHLVALDDATLKDIGLTRADVIWASELPLSQNASLELEKISRQNRRH